MHKLSAKLGYIIEGEPGYFYHRLGQWIKYGSAAEGYVWSDEEVTAIRDACKASKTKWKMEPKTAHPALYDDRSGVTVVTGKAVSIENLDLPATGGVMVPTADGILFDIKRITTRLGVNQIAASNPSI